MRLPEIASTPDVTSKGEAIADIETRAQKVKLDINNLERKVEELSGNAPGYPDSQTFVEVMGSKQIIDAMMSKDPEQNHIGCYGSSPLTCASLSLLQTHLKAHSGFVSNTLWI